MSRPNRGLLAALAIASVVVAAPPAFAQAPSAPPPYLSLAEALSRASGRDPGTAGSAARIAAGEAAVRQAGVKPNAALAVEVENLAGTGPYSLLDRSETTFSYERPIERGGKREARAGLARAQLSAVRLRAEVTRLDFLRDVQLAYAEALAAEAELLIAEARLASAEAAQANVMKRVKSARDPLYAGSRAEVLTAQAEIARDQAREAARTARAALAAYWGGTGDVSLRLEDFFGVKPPGEVVLGDSPDLLLLEAAQDSARAALAVERSRNVADPTLRGGVRYFGEGSDLAVLVGASIPLGVAKANRANVDRAQAEVVAAGQDVLAARIAREREIVRLTARQRALAVESERIRTAVIPHAITTVEQVTAGFNRGGFTHSDVNDAERALADARARRVAALREFHINQATLDRLTAAHRPLAAIANEERR